MDDRLAKLLFEDNVLSIQKRDSARIALLEKLATIKSVDLQTLPIPGTTNPPLAVTPGGWDKSVQYNDGGAFGGDANFLWDKNNEILTLGAGASTPYIKGGKPTTNNLGGGSLSINGGEATGNADGGQVIFQAGNADLIGNGGETRIYGGLSGATSGDGGDIVIYAGQVQTSGDGGDVIITPATGLGGGVDGVVTINGDVHFEDDNMVWDKTAQVLTVNATITSPEATGLSISGGDGAGTGDSDGGQLGIYAGDGGATEGDGGSVGIQAGSAQGTDSNGGDVIISPGNGTGSGVDGRIVLQGVVETSPYERHVQIAATTTGNPANQPVDVDFFTVGGLQFSTTGSKFAFCQWEIPDDWDGTDIYFEVDWFPDSGAISGTAAVRWTVEYRAIAESELINNGTSVTLDNGAGGDTNDYSQYQTKHSRMTMAYNNANQPLTAQDHLYFKISRDTGVANNFGGSVTVSAYEIIYNSKGLPTN